MRALVFISLSLLALCAPALGVDNQASGISNITLKEFLQLDPDARQQVFLLVTAEKRAELVSGHMRLWTERHRSRLTAAQLEFIEQSMSTITPELYRTRQNKAQQVAAAKRLREARALFSREDLDELFFLQAPLER